MHSYRSIFYVNNYGALALTFKDKNDYNKILEEDTFDINGLESFSESEDLQLITHHSNGNSTKIALKHTFNQNQIEWFKAGSALNLIAAENEGK